MNPDVILIQRRKFGKLHRVKFYHIRRMVASGKPVSYVRKPVFHLRFHNIKATINTTTIPAMTKVFLFVLWSSLPTVFMESVVAVVFADVATIFGVSVFFTAAITQLFAFNQYQYYHQHQYGCSCNDESIVVCYCTFYFCECAGTWCRIGRTCIGCCVWR